MNQIKTKFAVIAALAAVAFIAGCQSTATSTAGAKPYTSDKCIVSGDKLGEMGKPVVFVYQGQEIKLCCKNCRKDFDKDPAKYLSALGK
jgi:YHS domain-containing protein